MGFPFVQNSIALNSQNACAITIYKEVRVQHLAFVSCTNLLFYSFIW